MLLFVVFLPIVLSETIFQVRTSGFCTENGYPGSFISDKATCETQAGLVPWSDTTASTVSFSSYLPEGCVLHNNVLKLYLKTSTNQCSADYKCLCEITAPLCVVGVNTAACICSENACTSDVGLVCSASGECSHAPECVSGENLATCNCNGFDCTQETGLVCGTTCEHADSCDNTIGTISNSPPGGICKCGSIDCSEPYCYSDQSFCRNACPAGKYVSSLECVTCTVPGYYCPLGATTSPTEFSCPAGRFSSLTGIGSPDECNACAAGRFSGGTGLTSECLGRCSAGKYSAEMGLVSDSECLGRCSAGKYSGSTGLVSDSQCLGRCSAGKYSMGTGLQAETQCIECSKGKYSMEIGLKSDLECLGHCSKGKYSDATGLTSDGECNICSANKYQDEIGKSRCKGCPNDKIIHDTATASKHDSQDDCQLQIPVCLASEYLLNNKCKPCQTKHFCDGTSMTLCPPGSFCAGSGQIEACPTGRYGEMSGKISQEDACTKCKTGTFQNVVGQTYCSRGCPRGKFGNVIGASSESEACQNCPEGYMCESTAMNQPTICPRGSFQANKGAAKCDLCPINTYSNDFGSTKCQTCGENSDGQPYGTAGIGSNSQTQCQIIQRICPPGYESTSNDCRACPAGSSSVSGICALCSRGKYQPQDGQESCMVTNSVRCSKLLGCSDQNNDAPHVWKDFQEKNNIEEEQPFFSLVNIIVYGCIGGVILIIICSHRMCPECFKELDFAFSSEHVISDTHAKRVLNTRLGAAMTLTIPFVIGALSVFVFTDENTIIQHGLIPIATANLPHTHGLFKQINIQYKTQSAQKMTDCSFSQSTPTLNCSQITLLKDEYTCFHSTTCTLNPPLGGVNKIHLDMPNIFQSSEISITATPWNEITTNITQHIRNDEQMIGQPGNPSIIEYDVIRSVKSQTDIEPSYGIQLARRSMILKESEDGSISDSHRVSIYLYSTSDLFTLDISKKLEISTQISTILTYTISALSVLKVIKLILEKTIDKSYLTCAKETPRDIEMRQTVLEEKISNKPKSQTTHSP